ncbi:hypothetical protein [Kitasatospora cathayae]|uniref:hypothetical protein n=1 Tax=Kitasatospora cathayae TaxID=3004092 RepID=UPI0038601825
MQQDQGWADDRYGAVADAFAGDFTDFPELGAAVTVFVDGGKVVEPWGGAQSGSGLLLDSPAFRPLLGPRGFGNDGAGGRFACGDDEFGVGFGYVANRMIGHGDARADRLIEAVRGCLG